MKVESGWTYYYQIWHCCAVGKYLKLTYVNFIHSLTGTLSIFKLVGWDDDGAIVHDPVRTDSNLT